MMSSTMCVPWRFLYIIFFFSIRSEYILCKSSVVGEGTNGVIATTSNTTIDWEEDRHLSYREYNPRSQIIQNDLPWYDHKGKPIKANRCGTISSEKIDGKWYMVGSQSSKDFHKGGNVYLYESANLGSNSWRRVKKVYEFNPSRYVGILPPRNSTCSSCEIIQRYDDPNIIMVHCRLKLFISYNGIYGNYKMHLLKDPDYIRPGGLSFGGSSTYKEGEDLYLVTSRSRSNITRHIYVYKMNSNWTEIDTDSPPVKWEWKGFESPMILKRYKWYYIFASKTRRWAQSNTYYRRALSLTGLADAETSEVVMHPANTHEIRSMGSQFCFFQKFAPGKWIFGGRRHPTEGPEHFTNAYGKHVMAPAKFIKHVPHVYWKYSFDWKKYDYVNPTHDKHTHFGFGHKQVPCMDSTDKFWFAFVPGTKGSYKDCEWLKRFSVLERRHKCKKFRELKIRCPVSCETFKCKLM